MQLKMIRQWLKRPYFLPCILLGCVITVIVGAFCLAMPATKSVNAGVGLTPHTIVLDAGHGGEDGGTSSKDGTMEKDINLAVALRLRELLVSAGFEVKMIRETDVAVNDPNLATVKQRKASDIKNRLKFIENTPDCTFVSIHQNHFSESQYNGTQVFYSPNASGSQQLAAQIQTCVVQQLQPENKREIKPATQSIYLLWHSKVPAVLVECGFLSNPKEAQLLKTTEYQDKMALAIFDGIVAYFNGEQTEVASPT